MIKLNGEIVTPTVFSDNTSQVWKVQDLEARRSLYDT